MTSATRTPVKFRPQTTALGSDPFWGAPSFQRKPLKQNMRQIPAELHAPRLQTNLLVFTGLATDDGPSPLFKLSSRPKEMLPRVVAKSSCCCRHCTWAPWKAPLSRKQRPRRFHMAVPLSSFKKPKHLVPKQKCPKIYWRIWRISGGLTGLMVVTHRPLSSSFLGLPYRILNTNHTKELLRGLWVEP